MLISDKQHEANCRNAQQSTGPVTDEGKDASRFNAYRHGLRSSIAVVTEYERAAYEMLWRTLSAEWQPETATERLYLEQMCVSQVCLGRAARCERVPLDSGTPFAEALPQLALVSRYRTSLERSFSNALRELKQLKKERQAQAKAKTHKTQPVETAKPEPTPPHYVMSEPEEIHQVYCAPASTDTR